MRNQQFFTLISISLLLGSTIAQSASASTLGEFTRFLIWTHYTTQEKALHDIQNFHQFVKNTQAKVNSNASDKKEYARLTIESLSEVLNNEMGPLHYVPGAESIFLPTLTNALEEGSHNLDQNDFPQLMKNLAVAESELTEIKNEISNP